jgi:hypothetical protein
MHLKSILGLFVISACVGIAAAPVDSAHTWQTVLENDLMSRPTIYRKDVLMESEGGYFRLPVTPGMVKIFETIPKSEVESFLTHLTDVKIPATLKLDSGYVLTCIHAIEIKAPHTGPRTIVSSDKNGAVVEKTEVVYYLFPYSDPFFNISGKCKNPPNQSTDPTLASGTPPAGQESRHP